MINCELFYCKQNIPYPPFKNGLYLEEYFMNKLFSENISLKRKYIPAFWTNFQIENWFNSNKEQMQNALNEWVSNNPSENGYICVVQHDDGPLLQLPENTIIYGGCSGNVSIPLIYQDINNTLVSCEKKGFDEKHIFCSFVGNITANHILPNVRQVMFDKLYNKNNNFSIINSGGWQPSVNSELQQLFITTTINSKFALAPRGYGRASFRFFECFLLGTIPIYIWNDINWLPFQNIIDYSRLCISIHVSEIDNLEDILLSIDKTRYNDMLSYYNEIKHLFELEGMCSQIIKENS
jgi:hypothetical protein